MAPKDKPNASMKALSDLGGAMFLVVRKKRNTLGERETEEMKWLTEVIQA